MGENQKLQSTTLSSQVSLYSHDNKCYLIDRKVANKSQTLRRMLNAMTASEETPKIHIPKVPSDVLKKIIDYMEHYKDINQTHDEDTEEICAISNWDREFLKVDESVLCQLITVAHYLEIDGLIKATSKTIAGMITNKTPGQIRARFGIADDLMGVTDDDEEQDENVKVEKNDTKEVEVTEL